MKELGLAAKILGLDKCSDDVTGLNDATKGPVKSIGAAAMLEAVLPKSNDWNKVDLLDWMLPGSLKTDDSAGTVMVIEDKHNQVFVDADTGSTNSNEFYLPSESLTIFDWDDTLCPTTFLKSKGSDPAELSDAEKQSLRSFEVEVAKLLESAAKLGQVVI